MQKQRFEALSRICLNNWHYIDHRVLSFHEGVNFFTGHSGSGKSTVIDALQILLYANTDGRGFFNKAAADDSDRTLIEYLRGMVNIGENNEFRYLRNKNFSTTIVMELKRTDNGEAQCVGVVFDVQPSANEVVNRLFFWHYGELLENDYRIDGRAMSTEEIKERLSGTYAKEQYYFGTSNERFRKQLYDVYLGGLNSVRFPQLFKRAIPFKMNIRLEDFVKEYICMEEDIHIEDMQESVMQYGRMRRRIADTKEELLQLSEIESAYQQVEEKKEERRRYEYFMNVMEVHRLHQAVQELQDKIRNYQGDLKQQQQIQKEKEAEIEVLEAHNQELLKQIASSGYDELKKQLTALNELLDKLASSEARWEKTAAGLKQWEKVETASNAMLWDIERFRKRTIQEEELHRLKKALQQVREDTEELKKEVEAEIRELARQLKQAQDELGQLKLGKKTYPKEVEKARIYIGDRLQEKTGKAVQVDILAELLDIRDESWRNAIEGYLGSNKLVLAVEPKYAKLAMQIYEEMDQKKFYMVSVLDTEKVMEKTHVVQPRALAEEVVTKVPYARAYMDFLLGGVIKCADIDELRGHRVGITKKCVLYHSYRICHINPENYTTRAYIGEASLKRRIKQLEAEREKLQRRLLPKEEERKEYQAILELEALSLPAEDYLEWVHDCKSRIRKEKEKERLCQEMEVLLQKNIARLEEEQREISGVIREKRMERDQIIRGQADTENRIQECNASYLEANEQLIEKGKNFRREEALEQEVEAYLSQQKNQNYEGKRSYFFGKMNTAEKEIEERKAALRTKRSDYLRQYPNRDFSIEREDNEPYRALFSHLQDDSLDELQKKAEEQAREAAEMFKQDFVYKIRSSIKEALTKKDELNRIISKLNFGKDRYQFVIGKNKGPDGKFYDMFMNENLEINPKDLTDHIDHQLSLFGISQEQNYGELMGELISIFIPPDNASLEELEEAKRNMARYADYRTYLSFDMQQIIEGEETIKIRLSRMISKNSGGEGQNPLYIALLASFAQAYRINLSPKLQRDPTIRLVVLDEAFSKMDGEKVASCIELIRGLGFQAIISSTNDKIQNYLESVDKTFVFANPNKKHISIQEFERTEFDQLTQGMED